METNALSELFPLFNSASSETLEWLLSVAEEQSYPPDTEIISEDSWGKTVFLIVSGWVKVCYFAPESAITMEILGRGAVFGEIAVLDESPRSTNVITLSEVQVISVSAQRFIQMLFREPQLQQRMLQLAVRRIHQFYQYRQLRDHSPKVKLVKTLIALGENYGQATEKGIEILAISEQDLADLADISPEEAGEILEKLNAKGWLDREQFQQKVFLINIKQLSHLVKQL
jgi:CRP-like cAMP-binding protein